MRSGRGVELFLSLWKKKKGSEISNMVQLSLLLIAVTVIENAMFIFTASGKDIRFEMEIHFCNDNREYSGTMLV